MSLYVGAPDLKHQGKLVWPFGEDAVTAAYELVVQAREDLAQGVGLSVRGVVLPDWWWTATRLEPDGDSRWQLYAVDGEHGMGVVLTDEPNARVEPIIVRALAKAWALPTEEAQAIAAARAPEMEDSDMPLGAHVTPSRHDQVLLERLRLPQGRVVTWTRVAPGAGPAEFSRMQRAVGAYITVMVEAGDTRTVGIWDGDEDPAPEMQVRPVLRRLFKREGAWRYGVCFAPTL